jgi:hypothetical protein
MVPFNQARGALRSLFQVEGQTGGIRATLVLVCNTHVASVPMPLFAFIALEMAWPERPCPGGEPVGLARLRVHQVSVRPG